MDLSICIPARNEMFLLKTIESVLENMEGDTEIIAVLDGYWPDVGLPQHPRVNVIHYEESIGQRAATNVAAKLSRAKMVMKLDAHCSVDKGFDVKLIADLKDHPDWTMVPRMYNLHGFDWKCNKCGYRTYQGPTPVKCDKCDNTTAFERVIVWEPRKSRRSDFMRFDSDMHFQYWGEFEKRPEGQGEICDLLSHVGACWLMHRERYWELGGMDEAHGSWGQMGVEVSCKTWLSGGRQVINKNTWFSHMFRTQGGDFSFPYAMSGRQVADARKHSKRLFMEGTWPQAKYDLKWLLTKFWPVPGWTEEQLHSLKPLSYKPLEKPIVEELPKTEIALDEGPVMSGEITKEEFLPPVEPLVGKEPVFPDPDGLCKPTPTPRITIPGLRKGIVYYTDNRLDERVMKASQKQLLKAANGIPIIAVSLKPIDFGMNVVLPFERGHFTMFQQQLVGIELSDCDIVFLAEHDMLYHPSHFDFVPPTNEKYYFNENTYKVDSNSGQALFYYTKQTSGCCADRTLLLEHYRKRVERYKKDGKYDRNIGFEPGAHSYPRGIDSFGSERWMSPVPNIDIRHGLNLTKSRWNQDEFRNKRSCQGWTMADEVPGWGRTKGQMNSFLSALA